MNRRAAIVGLLALPCAARLSGASAARNQKDAGWRSLFNGKDFHGWETFLGKPHNSTDVPGHPRNERGDYANAIGVSKDPKAVFSIVETDGGPSIRISGEIYGALTTIAAFGDYHLRFEFKWGEKKWPPREHAVRDSGCCYHAVGPHGASYGFWMRSCEFQVQEGDCGDFYSLAGAIVDVEAGRKDPADPKSDPVYTKGAPRIVRHTKRIIKSADYEKPRGEWNSLELYCIGQTSAHVVNGRVNMMLTGIRHQVDGREMPLTKGRIQFQSEGAEVFFRNIAIRPIRELPALAYPALARSVRL